MTVMMMVHACFICFALCGRAMALVWHLPAWVPTGATMTAFRGMRLLCVRARLRACVCVCVCVWLGG